MATIYYIGIFLKKQGLKQHIVDRATLSGFTIREFTTKEILSTQKHVLF